MPLQEERKVRIRQIKIDRGIEKLEQAKSEWDVSKDENVQGDPYKTLFVSRIVRRLGNWACAASLSLA